MTTQEIINFEDVEESTGFALLPKGKYLVEVPDEEEGTEVRYGGEDSKNPGFPYVSYRARVIADMNGDEYVGRFLFGNIFFTPKALGQTKHYLRVLGISITANTVEAIAQAVAEALRGMEFVVKVGVEKARRPGDEPRNGIKDIINASEWGQEEDLPF